MSVWFRGAVVATALVTAAVAGAAPVGASMPTHATRLTVRSGHTISGINASLSAGGAITGQVTDVDSNPLSGATVEVLTARGQAVGFASTDGSGDYRVVALPPSTRGYAVCVTGTNATSTARTVAYGYVPQCNGSTTPWSGFTPPKNARFIPTSADETSPANFILADGGAITGKVTSRANGDPLTGYAYLFSNGGRGDGGFPVADGVYTAKDLAPGKYVMCFYAYSTSPKEHTGFVPQCYRDSTWSANSGPPSAARTVTVTSGAASEADQSMPVAAAITGRIRDGRTHAATSAASIVVFAHGKVLSIQTPDTHGTYEVQNLPAGTVDVCALSVDRALRSFAVRADRRADHPLAAAASRTLSTDAARAATTGQCWKKTPWSGKGSAPKAARELHLRRGATTSGIDLAVTPVTYRSHITGHVSDAAGGVKGAGVTAYLPDGTDVAYATSGKGGAYRLSLPASAKKGYVVCAGPPQEAVVTVAARRDSPRPALASACWRKAAWNGSARPPAGAPKVKVASGHTTSGIDITLPRTGSIAGTVTYQGAAVPNLSVIAFDTRGDFVGSGVTDAQGRYRVAGLSPAPGYLVCFSTAYSNTSSVDPEYGLSPQCYAGQPWDGLNY